MGQKLAGGAAMVWRTDSDTAVAPGVHVIGWFKRLNRAYVVWLEGEAHDWQYWTDGDCYDLGAPDLWMPIPPVPDAQR